MWRVVAIVSVLVALLALSAVEVQADDGSCWDAQIGPKGPCDTPNPTPLPDPCGPPNPKGECNEPEFRPVFTCAMCGTAIAFCQPPAWLGGAFGSWMLVVGVMGWLAWPLWRHRKKGRPIMDERQTQEEIGAMIRRRGFHK